jgi:hypothetical protein
MKIHKTAGAILWGALSILILPGLRAQTAGVGILTENLKGVFHVDAAANNPSSGNIPPERQADDIVITKEGYLGAGTVAPSAHLHIHTQNQPGVFPLRIAAGSPNNQDKMLTSDDNGAVSWQAPPVPPEAVVYPLKYVPQQIFTKNQPAQAGDSKFPVPEDGCYSMDVRLWGQGVLNRANQYTPPTWTVTRLQLRRKRGNEEKIVDEFQYNVASYMSVTCFVTLYATALQDDTLSLWIHPVEGFSTLTVGPTDPANGTIADWVKTKVLYKKLGINDDTQYFD